MDLRPSGVESVCNNTNGPIAVVCFLIWTSTGILRWDVDPNRVDPQTILHGKDRSNSLETITNVGVIRIMFKTSYYIVSRLEVRNSQHLIPMTVTCGDGSKEPEEEEHLLIKYKGKINVIIYAWKLTSDK